MTLPITVNPMEKKNYQPFVTFFIHTGSNRVITGKLAIRGHKVKNAQHGHWFRCIEQQPGEQFNLLL